MQSFLRFAALLVTCLAECLGSAQEQPPPAVDQAAQWELESITLAGGRQRQGYIRAVSDDEVDFVEVVRPPGKPMYLVGFSFAPATVVEMKPLSPAGRELLLERIGPLLTLKSRALIEAGRMEDVELETLKDGGATWLLHRQSWFDLVSGADEESTRRCAVRLEQIFRAYRRVLPPRREPEGRLEIRLFGSSDEYRRHLRARGLEIENPAYYSGRENRIVAGSELTLYGERLGQIRHDNEAVITRYEVAEKLLDGQLAIESAELMKSGFSRQQIRDEVRARRAAFEAEKQTMLRRITEVNRRNDARFAAVTEQMFARLFHEAFHAYARNFVEPPDGPEIPRWLNEGLAQVFESGRLEADALRIDAPNRENLLALKADLNGRDPLRLADLLTAEERAFLVTHDGAAGSRRQYLYSWGLAYYMTFHLDLLSGEALDAYLAAPGDERDPLRAFERLSRAPLSEFEPQWRSELLSLRPPR